MAETTSLITEDTLPVALQHTCKNCTHQFHGSYCNECGQKIAKRITVPHVMHDLVHGFTHADKGIFPFIRNLVIKPGIMAKAYIEGKRKIFNPYQYLILSVGLVIFLMTQSHFYESMESYNNRNAANMSSYLKKGMSDFNWFVKTYGNVITFLSLPLFALSAWWAFKKRNENYAEQVTIMVFAMCQINTLNSILLLTWIVFNLSGITSVLFSMLLMIFCFCITYRQYYGLKIHTSIGKGILVFIGGYIIQFLIMMLALIMYISYLKNAG